MEPEGAFIHENSNMAGLFDSARKELHANPNDCLDTRGLECIERIDLFKVAQTTTATATPAATKTSGHSNDKNGKNENQGDTNELNDEQKLEIAFNVLKFSIDGTNIIVNYKGSLYVVTDFKTSLEQIKNESQAVVKCMNEKDGNV